MRKRRKTAILMTMAIVGGTLLFTLSWLRLRGKAYLTAEVDRRITQTLGMPARVEIRELGFFGAHLSLELPTQNLKIEDIDLKWNPREVFRPPFPVDVVARKSGASENRAGIELIDYQIEAHAVVLGNAVKSVEGTVRAKTLRGAGQTLQNIDTKFQTDLRLIDVIVNAETPPPFALVLQAEAKGPWPLLTLEVSALNPKREFLVRGQGNLNVANSSGDLRVQRTLRFPDEFRLLEPFLGEYVDKIKKPRGNLELQAAIALKNDGKMNGQARIRTRALGFELDGFPVRDIDTDVRLPRLFPVRSAPRQKIRIAAVGSSLPFQKTEIEFSLDSINKLRVHEMKTEWAGGRLSPTAFAIQMSPLTFQTRVEIREVDLESVIEGAQLDRIRAKGRLDGTLPMVYHEDFLFIEKGRLSSGNVPGWIHYTDEATQATEKEILTMEQFQSLIEKGQQALAFKALDNFHYTQLELDVNRSPATGLEASLKVKGKNPDLGKGMPFEFNIGLSGHLESAVKQSLLGALMDPETLAEKMQTKSKDKKVISP